ncbi:MAG: hypothetical protein WCO19_00290 [Candidatus Saccharibacteria bacterium]
MKLIRINLPQYKIDELPDHEALGKIVDQELKKHFMGQSILVRGIASSEHPDITIEELIDTIKSTGTDRYDPTRKGDRYENIDNKHIDMFAFPHSVTEDSSIFEDVVYGFYHSAIGVHGKPQRIDILTIYDATKMTKVVHQYEGRDDIKEDGYVFNDTKNRVDAILGIVRID